MTSRRVDRALWFAIFAPPLAWSVDLLASIAIEQDYCASQLVRTFRPWGSVTPSLFVVAIVALIVSLSAGIVSWAVRDPHASVYQRDGNGRGATIPDRQRFMASAALLSCGLFTFGILLRALAPLVLPSALCYTR